MEMRDVNCVLDKNIPKYMYKVNKSWFRNVVPESLFQNIVTEYHFWNTNFVF